MYKVSVKLSYKASGLGAINSEDLSTLKKELKEHYVSNLTPNGGPQAGGALDTIVEILLDVTFTDFCKMIRDGIIVGAVVKFNDKFILKPLFKAFSKIEIQNKYWDYARVSFLFDGTEVVVYGMAELFTSRLGTVFQALSNHFNNLDSPHRITIPIAKERDELGNVVFQNYEGGSDFELEDYIKYWGLSDLWGDRKVYDVQQSVVLNESWEH